MTGKELFQEIGNISEEYVAEAERYSKKAGSMVAVWRRKIAGNASFGKTLAAAACLVVCAGLVFMVQKLGVSQDAAEESVMDYENMAVEMAQAESSMAESVVAQSITAGVEEKAEEMETRPETEASIAPEAAEEEYDVKESLNKKEKTGQEDKPATGESMAIGDNQSGSGVESRIDELVNEEMSESMIWDAELVKEKMASYPNKYEDILKLESVYILVHGKAEKGQEIWDTFVESVDTGESAQAEIIRFTVEGDPIIETVFFDGDVFYLCVDNSRDSYRGSGDAYFEAQYSSLVKEEKMLEGGGKSIEYCLTDGEKEYSIVYFVK